MGRVGLLSQSQINLSVSGTMGGMAPPGRAFCFGGTPHLRAFEAAEGDWGRGWGVWGGPAAWLFPLWVSDRGEGHMDSLGVNRQAQRRWAGGLLRRQWHTDDFICLFIDFCYQIMKLIGTLSVHGWHLGLVAMATS